MLLRLKNAAAKKDWDANKEITSIVIGTEFTELVALYNGRFFVLELQLLLITMFIDNKDQVR